jgi:predicted nucleic acid-binding protein
MATVEWSKLLAAMEAPRVYVDTSVFGGCFDHQFERDSRAFFDLVRKGRVTALVSDLVTGEIDGAPEYVQALLASLPAKHVEPATVDDDVRRLARNYIDWGVLTERSWNDAQHVAAATRARADAIASWNFRDIVAFDRIRGFNATNLTHGYGLLVILSPQGIGNAAED